MQPSFIDELLFDVSCARDDLRLLSVDVQLPDNFCGLVAVHLRHRQVHENQTIDCVSLECSLDFLHAVVAIMCRVDEAIQPRELIHGFDSHPQPLNVEHLVVDDQDAAARLIRQCYVLQF